MNDRRADFDALRAFARQGDQQAFAALARRHLDLVYAVALRKVSDPGAAQEISQTVFASLARKAWSFGPDDSLPAWLHRTTLLEAKQWWRGELRRRRREETAAQLGTTMKTPDDQPALHALVPLLDEALLSLRETDRTALLLRYYESRSLRDVGESIGVREDAAQKRVAGALETLTRFFQRRGYRTVTVAAAATALQQSATAAPAAVAASIFQTALQTAPPALGTVTMLFARLAGLSKIQTAAACLALAAVPVAWQCNHIQDTQQQIATVQNQITLTQTHQQELNVQVQNLQPELIRLQAALADLNETEAQRAEIERRLLALKERIRGLLKDPNYHWPDDLPFVRIPKSAVAAIRFNLIIMQPGIIPPEVRELLGLTPEERQAMEDSAGRYFASLEQQINTRVYETNGPSQSWSKMIPPDAKTSAVFFIPPLGDEVTEVSGRMFADIDSVLGPDRASIFDKGTNSFGGLATGQVVSRAFGQQSQEVGVWIQDATPAHPEPQAGYFWGTKDFAFSSTFELTNAPGTDGSFAAQFESVQNLNLSPAITSRMLQWYLKQARDLFATPSQP